MELKARTAKYEDATQAARYKAELEQRGEKNVLMWLVAPHIPRSVCEFLDRIGIQYSEIHTVEFRNVAQRHGIQLATENETPAAEIPPTFRVDAGSPLKAIGLGSAKVETGPRVTAPASMRWGASGRDLILRNPELFDERQFSRRPRRRCGRHRSAKPAPVLPISARRPAAARGGGSAAEFPAG